MSQPARIAAAATFVLLSVLFAYYRISQIPRVGDASDLEGTTGDPMDALTSEANWATAPIPVEDASLVHDDDLVVGVLVNGRARAYPIRGFEMEEHVNDTIDDEPLVATW